MRSVSVNDLLIKGKYLGFTITSLPKSNYRLLKSGIIGGGFQGKISECMAYLDGFEAASKIEELNDLLAIRNG